MKRRNNFFEDELNTQRLDEVTNYVISNLTLGEILKMTRNICYDMVCYYDDQTKGIIYQSDKYTETNRNQACRLQRLVSSACDLFAQSIINHREFDEEYLNKYLNGGAMEIKINQLQKQIDNAIDYIKDEMETSKGIFNDIVLCEDTAIELLDTLKGE